MGINTNIKELKKDINKYRKNLILKAKKKGLYENFGQKEVRKLKDKYDFFDRSLGDLILDFDKWAMNVDDRSLKD